MIKEIANQLVGQFAANLRAQIDQPAAAPSGPAPEAAAPTPVSGLKLLIAALRALLTRWFARAS